MSAHGKALKGDKTDKDLEVSLATDTLEDGTVLEYESLEKEIEVFIIVEGEDPKVATDKTYTLSDGQKIVVVDGKISEIMPKEEEETEDVELSEEQKKIVAVSLAFDITALESLVNLKVDGWHTIEFSVTDGIVQWADLRSNTVKALLSEQVDPVKLELAKEKTKVVSLETDKVKLSDEVKVLQKLNDRKNPLEKGVKLDEEKPKTAYEIELGL
jgi:hypothetical protein